MRAGRGWGRGRSGQECGCGWMREGGGAGAQEWEGGGLDALRGAGGWRPARAGGGGTRGNERVPLFIQRKNKERAICDVLIPVSNHKLSNLNRNKNITAVRLDFRIC